MQTALLLTVLAPALVGAGLVALALTLGGRDRPAAAGFLALVAPAGALAACVPVRGWPGLPPTDASLWPIWLGLVIAAFAAWSSARPLPAVAAWLGRGALALLVALLVARPLMSSTWSMGSSALVAVATAALTAACWGAVERRAAAATGPGVPLGLAALCAVTAATLGASGTALLAQCVGGMAAGTGVLFLATLKWELPAKAAVGPTVALLGGFLLGGALYAEVTLASVALLAAAALAVGLVPWPASWRAGIKAAVAHGATVAVLGGAAVGASLLPQATTTDDAASEGDADDYDGYGY